MNIEKRIAVGQFGLTLILLLAATFTGTTAHAFHYGNRCVPTDYVVTDKYDDHHYQIESDGHTVRRVGLLETTTTRISVGQQYIHMRFVKTQAMEMTNGFKELVDLWKECSDGN